MKIRIDSQIAPLTTAAACWLAACNGQLAVVDTLDSRCTCASSDSLQALGCGRLGDPTLEARVQTTADGGVVAFNPCTPDLDCKVFYWAPSAPTRSIARGLLIDLGASGDVLVSGDDGTSLLRAGGRGGTMNIGLDAIAGRGALSADGHTVIGAVYDGNGVELARANVETGVIELLGKVANLALAQLYVNADATAIVGNAGDPSRPSHLGGPSEFGVFRWSEQGLSLGVLGVAAGTFLSLEALSADGSVIAGRSGHAHFRWSAADGYVEIASPSGRSETWLSADGSVVAGSLDPDGVRDSSAFRWTAGTGLVEIAPGSTTLAAGMSDDGRVVAANTWEDAQLDGALAQQTFVWDSVHGTRSIQDILRVRGIDATGWQFGQVHALSGNGNVLVGEAECSGVRTLYRLVLSGD
jgi:uncharacterized membrane protein